MREQLYIEDRKTCLACSPGGHFSEMMRATSSIRFTQAFHVTFYEPHLTKENIDQVYYLTHPQRSVFRTLLNFYEAFWVLRKERPELLISTGADVAVPIFCLARLMGVKTIFIETAGSLEPTLSGKLTYYFADLFIVQWPERLKRYPKAMLAEGILL